MTQSPLVLAIAGDDPGGQAGLARDRAVLEAIGCRVASIRTARTAQDPSRLLAVWPETRRDVVEGIQQVLAQESVAAVKIGMLASEAIVSGVLECLRTYGGPVVLDPVLTSSAGLSLLEESAYGRLADLASCCSLVTPNLPEFERLGGAAWLQVHGAPTLLKGGHATGNRVDDQLLYADGSVRVFSHPRLAGPSPRGTGCALSSAIAGYLAHGKDLEEAVGCGVDWLQENLF